MDESTRRQINWVIIIGVVAVLIVWGVARSQRLARLQQQLANGTPAQQIAATQELIDGRRLAEAAKDQPRWVHERAVSAVAHISTPQAWYQLLTVWYLLDAPVQQQATQLLTNAGNSAIPTLTEALKDKDANTRKGVAAVLIAIGEPVIPYMLPLMDAWDDYVRAGASAVLGGVAEPAIDEVITLIKKARPAPGQDADELLRERAAAQVALKTMKATAFPAIIADLLTDDNTDVRGIGTSLLGAIADRALALPPEDAINALYPLLDRLHNDSSYAVRRKAAVALGLLGDVARDHGAGAVLVARLQDTREHPDVRAAVAEALGKLADPAAAAPLVGVLISSRQGIDNELVSALERIGPRAVPALAIAVVNPSPDTQLLAVRALANIAGAKPIIPLARALSSSGPDVRRAAAEALRGRAIKDLTAAGPAVSDPLIKALYDRDWHVYYAARDALSKCGSPVIASLLTVLASGNARATHMAQQALVRIGRPAIAGLIATLKQADVESEAARWATVALGEMGATAIAALGDVAADSTQPISVREAAVVALGRTRSKAAMAVLKDTLVGADPPVAVAIMRAVGQIAVQEGPELLLAGLQASSQQVREAAMQALGEWRNDAPQQQLIQLLKDPDPDIQYRAAVALVSGIAARAQTSVAEIGAVTEIDLDDALTRTVGQLLSQAAGDDAADPAIRHAAIEALGTMAYAEGIDALGELLKGGGEYAADAAQAVAHIGVSTAAREAAEETGELTKEARLLIDLLIAPDTADDIRLQAAVALAMMQIGPVDTLIRELKDAPEDIRLWIVATLGATAKYATEAVYEARQRAKDSTYREWLAVTMVCIDDDRSLKALKHMPEQEKPSVEKSKPATELTEHIRLQMK